MLDLQIAKEQILESVSIKEIIEKYTFNIIRHNRCKCFACIGEQNNTMSIGKGYAYCFRCGNSYNQIQAVMEIEKCNFITACKSIIANFKLSIDLGKELSQEEQKELLKRKYENERAMQKETLKKIYCKYVSNLILTKLKKCEDYFFANAKKDIDKYYEDDKLVLNIMRCENEIKRLEWLYCKINELPLDEKLSYNYLLPKESIEILKMIYQEKISI